MECPRDAGGEICILNQQSDVGLQRLPAAEGSDSVQEKRRECRAMHALPRPVGDRLFNQLIHFIVRNRLQARRRLADYHSR